MNSIVFILGLSLGFLDSALGQTEQCGGPYPAASVADAILYFGRCNYPTYKLNANCILSSCPALNVTCPLTSTGSVNPTALNNAVSILNTCIGQQGLVCGIDMTHNPLVPIAWTTQSLIPSSVATGSVTLNPGSSFLNGLSGANFTVIHTTGPITLLIQAPDINTRASYNCVFSVPLTSVLNYITSVSAPNVTSDYHLALNATVSIGLSATQPPVIHTIGETHQLSGAYSNFVNATGSPLSQTIGSFFNQGMNTLLQVSVIPSDAINFLSTYAALGLQAAQLNCP